MNEQLDTILRDYKNGQKLDGSGDLYTIVDARQSLLQLTQSEYKRGYNQALSDDEEYDSGHDSINSRYNQQLGRNKLRAEQRLSLKEKIDG